MTNIIIQLICQFREVLSTLEIFIAILALIPALLMGNNSGLNSRAVSTALALVGEKPFRLARVTIRCDPMRMLTLFLLQMEHAFLCIDVHAEIAQEVEAKQAGDPRIGKDIVHGSRQIADFHPTDVNRLEAHERCLNDSIGRLKGCGPTILFSIDVEFFGDGTRDHRVACAGIDDELRGCFLVQRGLDDDDLSLPFEWD